MIQDIIFISCLFSKIQNFHHIQLSMNQSPVKEIMDVLNCQEPAFRNFFQEFNCEGCTITHQHHLQVELIESRGENFEILNRYARMNEGHLEKVTEIQIQNRIIKIIDAFFITKILDKKVSQLDSKAPKKNARRIIFARTFSHDKKQANGSVSKLRSTKNLIKNIICLFRTWIQESFQDNNEVKGIDFQKINRSRYNNKLIIDISKNQILRKLFMIFSQKQGENFINKSKIRDKQLHFEALKRYKRICEDQESNSSKKRQNESNSQSNIKQQS